MEWVTGMYTVVSSALQGGRAQSLLREQPPLFAPLGVLQTRLFPRYAMKLKDV